MSEVPDPKGIKRERKSRRSHKNSRDGCPNCRSKRIKCTEELPSCENCVKKGYRCGYLEFPLEKLEIIRKKNDLKKSQLEKSSILVAGALQTPPTDASYSVSSGTNGSIDIGSPEHLKKHRTAIKIRQRVRSTWESSPDMSNLRSNTYQKTLRVMTDKSEAGLSPIFRSIEGVDFAHRDGNNEVNAKPASKEDLFYGTSEYIDLLFRSPVGDELSPGVSTTNVENGNTTDYGHASLKQDPWMEVPEVNMVNLKESRSKMLPLGMIHEVKFLKQEIPVSLQNMILDNTIKEIRNGNSHLKAVTSNVREAAFRPVWSEQQALHFWMVVFQQAMVLDLYFNYFIDKAVNILMRASEAVVNGEIDISLLPSTFSGDSPPSDSPAPQLSFFYTKEDLHLLTCKSYVTYGRFIRELRESINKYHNEYPAKISLYWAWSCYITLDSDFTTFCLMIRGTLVVLHNAVQEAKSLEDISPAIRQEFMMIHDFTHASKFVDYQFDIIQELAANFQAYQQIVGDFIFRYEHGEAFDEDLVRVLKDPIFRHDCHELDKFFHNLQTHYYPQCTEINRYCKAQNSMSQDSQNYFVSPKLVFEMAYEWFRIYPGDRMSLNSHNNPLKKVLYFFYHALAKTLAHVFTPLKSVLIVDVCNIMFTKVGMPLPEFDVYDRPLYASIEPLARGLFKTIKFFENRLRLYCHHLENCGILSSKFINAVDHAVPSHWTHRDIVRIEPSKVAVLEQQLTSITAQLIGAENYAFFPRIRNDETCALLIQKETERQIYAIKNEPFTFDWSIGLLNHDFNPTEIVTRFVNTRLHELHTQEQPSLEVLKIHNNELLRSRDEIKKALERSLDAVHVKVES